MQVHPPDISFRDFEKVMLRARPTVSKDDLGIFEKYKNEFGGFTMRFCSCTAHWSMGYVANLSALRMWKCV
jgi:Vps4 C terminal oligomerisation domain